MNRTEAIARYRKARATYEWAAKKACTGAPFDVAVRDNLPDLEVVYVVDGREVVTERKATMEEWVDAAEYTMGEFCDRYTVRNAIDPLGDWEWEQMEIAAGRIW